MTKLLDIATIKEFLDELPGQREFIIRFTSDGIRLYIEQKVGDKVLKNTTLLDWDDLRFCKIDLLAKRINYLIETVTGIGPWTEDKL